MRSLMILRVVLLSLISLFYGCTAVQPFPHSARAGDTITLAVGSPEGMTRANTQVQYTPDSMGIPIDLTSQMRAIVKLHPDKASPAYQDSLANYIIDYAAHEPWLTVIVLDLPVDLPVGDGDVQITTAASYPPEVINVNDALIPLTITGTGGTPGDFAYYSSNLTVTTAGDLTQLESYPVILVKPVYEGISSIHPYYGSADIVIRLQGLTGPRPINIVPMDADAFTRSQTRMIWDRDGETVRLIFTSAKGTMRYYEPSARIVFSNSTVYEAVVPTIVSAKFYDKDGNEMVETPTMQIVYE